MDSVRRRGVLMAYLAAISHCGRYADQYVFPDGKEGVEIVAVSHATLAFVLSKVWVTCGVGCLVLCECAAVRDARARFCWCGGLAPISSTGWHSGSLVVGLTLTIQVVGRAVLHRWCLLFFSCYLLPFEFFVLAPASCCLLHSRAFATFCDMLLVAL